jgi:hypothetical protein
MALAATALTVLIALCLLKVVLDENADNAKTPVAMTTPSPPSAAETDATTTRNAAESETAPPNKKMTARARKGNITNKEGDSETNPEEPKKVK